MKKIFALVLLSVFIATFAQSKTPWPPPSQPGNLNITVVASDSPQYLHDWVDPAKHNKVTIRRINKIKAEQIAYCGFLISGLTPSPAPDSSVYFSVGFKFYGPDGSLVFEQPIYTQGKMNDPQKPTYIMADPALDLIMEKSDPVGIYTIVGIVTDLVTKQKATGSYKLSLIK